MSVATPTVIPRPPIFPRLLPKPPQPHPIPLDRSGRWAERVYPRRDLAQEMDDLSDEENELEDITLDIKNRGYNSMIPIGKMFTQYEEKNDADDGSEGDDSRSSHPDSQGSASEEEGDESEEEEEGGDLDADMEDMDEEPGNMTAETDPDDMDDGEADFYDA
ncbi:hypothetical protein DENSPDRAFT_835048 [Dentipellis sp. KUC8613]|nr:hypothetical protein DENSPDRAFT_835048 [Dentipellis sp. KUC8613]